ncbi:transketolase [Alphaproteobacteria bacterium]|nr:transketolase [Alphaproteobacteria bacterium]
MRKTSLNCVYEMAITDDRIVFIGSDLGPGVLEDMKTNISDRFFMEGVAEQHIIGMAAGMAMNGFIPYVNTIATFLTRRCFEQVAIDLCLHDLPVRLIANGGGVVYAPLGPTHLAMEDISLLRSLPNMTIVAVCDADEMKRFMHHSKDWPHPIYIRLGKGGDAIISKEENGFELGKAIPMKHGNDGAIISTGVMTQVALEAAEMLTQQGINVSVTHMHTIKPLDENAVINVAQNASIVITIEEHIRHGGLGSAVLETLNDYRPDLLTKITRMGFSDQFADEYGSQATLLERYGLTAENLVTTMRSKIGV